MAGRRVAVGLVLGFLSWGALAVRSTSQSTSQPTSQSSSQSSAPGSGATANHPQADTGTSSSKKLHRHHIQVEEESSVPPELTQAEELIQKKDYAGAEPLLRKVVAGAGGNVASTNPAGGDGADSGAAGDSSSDSSTYVAWFDLGFVENELGKVEDSIAAYRKSVVAKPDVFESNLNLGLQLAKTHQPDAEQFLRAATILKPTNHAAEGLFRAWVSLGHVEEATKPDEAIAAYRQAALLQPKDAEPHLSAGSLLEKENKFADAEQEYKQALALDPEPDAPLTGLANIYVRGRRWPEAEDALRKLVAVQPANAAAHLQLGTVLKGEEKSDAAIAELQAGLKLAPGDATAQRELADAYAAAGKNDLAEAAYRALAAGTPNDPDLHCRLGESLLREKKFVEAQKEFLEAVRLKPDFGVAYGDLAFAAGENKDFALTIKALDARGKFLPEIPNTYFMRASAYDHLKDFKKAAVNYRLFLNTANGKYPDQEWQAKHRLIAIEPKK